MAPQLNPVYLVEPDAEMAAAYKAFLDEFVTAGEEGILYNIPSEIRDPEECIRDLKNHAEGFELPEEWVPCSAYWLVSHERVLLGEIHIRHRLTDALENYGGHIGYMVRPSERGKGYATRMLALALEKAHEMGMVRIMISCEPGNAASARVIQKNGGVLINEPGRTSERRAARYWVELI